MNCTKMRYYGGLGMSGMRSHAHAPMRTTFSLRVPFSHVLLSMTGLFAYNYRMRELLRVRSHVQFFSVFLQSKINK